MECVENIGKKKRKKKFGKNTRGLVDEEELETISERKERRRIKLLERKKQGTRKKKEGWRK